MELLLPAGSFEKLQFALAYGADAVYLGTPSYTLRSGASFSWEDLPTAIRYAQERGKKAYLTLNAFPHPEALERLEGDLPKIVEAAPDALIVSDPGVIETVRDLSIPLHLSTQASTVNGKAARFWARQGISRIILARELSLDEIERIHREAPEVELEAFVHGAMCMAYSGRCLISNFLAERDANGGACAQPCRWKYRLVEELRPEQALPIEEDEQGSYILNSRDLCMIEHLPRLIASGVVSLKVEGRAKSAFYVAGVARAYRQALDRLENSEKFEVTDLLAELHRLPHRGYTTGFFFGKPQGIDHDYASGMPHRPTKFTGRILGWEEGWATVQVRDTLRLGDRVELMSPNTIEGFTIEQMQLGEEAVSVAHPGQIVRLQSPRAEEWSILRTEGIPCDC